MRRAHSPTQCYLAVAVLASQCSVSMRVPLHDGDPPKLFDEDPGTI